MAITLANFRHFANQPLPVGADADQVVHLNADRPGFATKNWQKLGSRSAEFKRENQRIRQELVDSLRTMLGGATLDKLPKALREQLKLGDFDMDAQGRVKSDRPLTMRRIVAISKAVIEWQNTCRRSMEHIASSAPFLALPDQRRAEAQLTRLFDSRRPLPANLSGTTLEKSAQYMFAQGLKPFHARLALNCLSKLKSEGVKVPSGRTTSDRLVKLSRLIADTIAPTVRQFGDQVRLFREGLHADPPLDPRDSELAKDGVGEEGIGAEDLGNTYQLVMMLLRHENPEVDGLINAAGEQDLVALDDERDAKFDELTAVSLEKDAMKGRLGDPDLSPAARQKLERQVADLEKREFTLSVALNLLPRVRGQVSTRILDPLAVQYDNNKAIPLTRNEFTPLSKLFNRSQPKNFSAERMFVRNGKPGINGFDADRKIERMFEGVDRTTFADRANRIAASHVKVVVLEEMMKQLNPDEKTVRDFDKDRNREHLVSRDGTRLPNRSESPMSEINDVFAQQLRRKDTVRYEDLSKIEKTKIMLMKSMLHQMVESIPFYAVTEAMSPNGDRRNVNSIMMVGGGLAQSQNITRFSFDDDGGMTVSVFRTNKCSEIGLGFNKDGEENGALESENPITATTRIDLHISPEEVERIASLDWSRLDIAQVTSSYDAYDSHGTNPVPNFYENFPANNIPEEFRLNIETSIHVSYEITD